MKKIIGLVFGTVCGMLMLIPQGARAVPGAGVFSDLAVVGPGGEVLVYYRDGNDVVVRNCGKGYPIIKKRSDCATVGQENRIPVATFKQVLKSEFLIGDGDKVKPITKEEVEAYRKADPTRAKELELRTQELDRKLAQIKAFIGNYGEDEQSKKDLAETEKLLAEARKELTTARVGTAAIKKVNDLIDDIVDKKISSSEITAVSSAKSSDQAMYTLLKQYDASKVECGTDEILKGTRGSEPASGGEPKANEAAMLENWLIPSAYAAEITTEQRIKNCSALPGSTKKTRAGVTWNLVARKQDRSTKKFYEVWKDSKTGLLWGDRLDSDYNHYNAVELNLTGDKVMQEKACASSEGKRAYAGIGEKSFGLPKIEEFEKAEQDGVREVVPNMRDYWFWSASLDPYSSDFARGFFGYGGGSYGVGSRDYGFSVRCVGR